MKSFSKWPPGSYIGFFGFPTLTLVWLWLSTPNFNSTILDDVIKWKHFPCYWAFVRGIHWGPVNKGQWRGASMFSLICIWINGWVNNHEAADLRHYHAHYDVIVIPYYMFWFPDSSFSLALNFKSKLKLHINFVYGEKEAALFSAMSLTKWPPGGHIGFFTDSKFILAWNIRSKLQ